MARIQNSKLFYLSLRMNEVNVAISHITIANEITASGFALLVMTNPILNFIGAKPNRAHFGATFCGPKGGHLRCLL